MLRRKGFTLVEILIVVVIIGILVAIGLPSYNAIQEKTLNGEAKAILILVQKAERIHRMEKGYYYPNLSVSSVITDINSNLRLSLPTASSTWAISVDNRVSGSEFATASRLGRTWKIDFPNSAPETSACSGAGCP